MKKMNVAVMLTELSGEYSNILLRGINGFFSGKNVNVIPCQVKLPDVSWGHFEYQYWAGLNLLESDSIDGVIVVSSFFISSLSLEKFTSILRGLSHKPIVSVGVDLKYENACSLKTDISETYEKLVQHLVEKHNRKRIAFLSANSTASSEALERFESYKKALKDNNLPFDESLVYEGNFTIDSGERAMSDFKSPEDVPFDAILCANDLMATGALNRLINIGVSIPDQVCVTGFDDYAQAKMMDPSITTISQKIFQQGRVSAELVYKKINGESVDKQNYIQLENIYRQSCGCVGLDDIRTNYLLESGTPVLRKRSFKRRSFDYFMNSNREKESFYYLMDVLQVSETLTDLFTRISQILYSVDIRRMALCLYDEPITYLKGEDFSLPNEVELVLVEDRENGKEMIFPKIRYNPKEKLLPEEVFDQDYKDYILEPVFYGEKQYGYVFLNFHDRNYYQILLYIKALSSAIAASYEYTKKQEENVKLQKLNQDLSSDNDLLSTTSKTDEMTQVFNRRGFMFAGKQVLGLSVSKIKKGAVFFCDMDGLKTINDTYGHKMGDQAIQTVAKSLKENFALEDVIGRLGGDEFAVVSGLLTADSFDEKYRQVNDTCARIAAEKNLPFKVAVSMGVIEFTEQNTDLEKLLAEADEKQYELKKKKKVARGM